MNGRIPFSAGGDAKDLLSINPCLPKPSLRFAPIQKTRGNRESW
ncbi:hypothetical protein [Candidatus Methylacidiphilum fumarolicum]|nr:hypothetical protein [Candidatus Methylacidiphilum fumarolicum]